MAGYIALLCCFLAYAMAFSPDELPLCGGPVLTYGAAKSTYPALADALTIVEQHPMATWWTDNNSTYRAQVETLMGHCNTSTVPTIVVYALPQKDCHAGYSNLGFIKDTSQYIAFVQELADLVGTRPVIYVLEPDAVGLASDGGCGHAAGYLANMQRATSILTARNPNARLYVDVGYWMLQTDAKSRQVAAAMQVVGAASRPGAVRGIVLNTSNYRRVAEMATLCSNFVNLTGNPQWRCVVDTSRNYRTPTTSNEWCNNKFGAIGVPPTRNTGYPGVLDLFLWIKVPGESDGTCANSSAPGGATHSSDAMPGPPAAIFFPQAFRKQWDQGYFVDKKLGALLVDKVETKPLVGVLPQEVESKPPVVSSAITTSAPTLSTVLPMVTTTIPEMTSPPPSVNQVVPSAVLSEGVEHEQDATNLTWSVVGAVVLGCVILVLALYAVFRKRRREVKAVDVVLLSVKVS
ncbi:hypothetical protein DYB28_013805 [Aphanomyces astaci]|uniref:Glycoside hydrolase n=1 Tax=Aphanomyces astaci TaxID=112090 RepID=A0A9X8DS69_APHAT|nr:hypothetical protein DYB28_013805 [Aphanomyces astaci]